MRIVVLLSMLPTAAAIALRTMGELAHPEANYAQHLKELRQRSDPLEAAQYLIDNGFFAAALVGTIADNERRNERLAKFCQTNERILYAPSNLDTVGRQLGIGLQPQVNYSNLAQAVVANSESLTPRNLRETRLKVVDEVNCGAWLYSPFMPRRSSKGEGVAGHIDAIFEPDDGRNRWALTSLINPTLSRCGVVLQRMKKAGFRSFDHTPPQTLLEKLYADAPPNALVGNWNNVIATDVEEEEGRDLTFARLASAQAGMEDQVIYETMMIVKIWLPIQEYRQACLIRELQEISKVQSGGHPLTIGTHSGINSCGQLTGALFDPSQRLSCENLMDIYNRAIDTSTECWMVNVRGSKLEPFDFVINRNRDGFIQIDKENARNIFNHYLTAPTLSNARKGRSSYCENYGTCTIPHPDPEAQLFYDAAADIALEMLERKQVE